MNLHELIRKAPKIGVFGSDQQHCSEHAAAVAEQVGRLLAERGAIIFNGGHGGVMEGVCRGAAAAGGISISLLPESDSRDANGHASLLIPTGIGFARGQILTNTVDGAILIEGGIGTYSEAAMMYWLQKPTVAIVSSGGISAELGGKVLDKRNHPPILASKDAAEAVALLFEQLGASAVNR